MLALLSSFDVVSCFFVYYYYRVLLSLSFHFFSLLFIIYSRRTLSVSPFFFFLMIRRPPRSTLDRSSAASDVYKRQIKNLALVDDLTWELGSGLIGVTGQTGAGKSMIVGALKLILGEPVSYTHLRAHETVLDIVCRLLLEKKKEHGHHINLNSIYDT